MVNKLNPEQHLIYNVGVGERNDINHPHYFFREKINQIRRLNIFYLDSVVTFILLKYEVK